MSKISKVQSARSSLHIVLGELSCRSRAATLTHLHPWLRGTCKTHGHIRAVLQWLCLQGTANAAALISIRLLKYKVITAQVKKKGRLLRIHLTKEQNDPYLIKQSKQSSTNSPRTTGNKRYSQNLWKK